MAFIKKIMKLQGIFKKNYFYRWVSDWIDPCMGVSMVLLSGATVTHMRYQLWLYIMLNARLNILEPTLLGLTSCDYAVLCWRPVMLYSFRMELSQIFSAHQREFQMYSLLVLSNMEENMALMLSLYWAMFLFSSIH